MGIFSKLFRGKPKEKQPAPEPPAAPAPEQPVPAPVEPVTPAPAPVPEPAPVAPKPPEPAPKPDTVEKKYKVTGMEHYKDNILSLSYENSNYSLNKRELIDDYLTDEYIYEREIDVVRVELVPEPDNPHDPKAIKVILDGYHVGYIKAGSCTHLLKVIREDRIQKITCEAGGGRYKYVSLDGYTESGKEIYTLDRGTAPWFVHLTVTEKIKPTRKKRTV